MKKHDLLLLISFIIELVFEMFRYGVNKISPFPAVNDSMFTQLYAYFVAEHLSFILIAIAMYMVAKNKPESLLTVFVFALLKTGDFTEFMITDSTVWYRFNMFAFKYNDVPVKVIAPMSWNMIQFSIFAGLCFVSEVKFQLKRHGVI